MADAGIRIELDDAQLRTALARLARFVRNPEPAFDEIGARLELTTLRRFRTETGPDGERWKPSGKRGGQTLTASGRLGSIRRFVSRDEAGVGTDVAYGPIHQFGGTIPPRVIRPRSKKALAWPGARHPVKEVRHPGSTMPARPFLGVSSGDERAILDIISDHVERALGSR